MPDDLRSSKETNFWGGFLNKSPDQSTAKKSKRNNCEDSVISNRIREFSVSPKPSHMKSMISERLRANTQLRID